MINERELIFQQCTIICYEKKDNKECKIKKMSRHLIRVSELKKMKKFQQELIKKLTYKENWRKGRRKLKRPDVRQFGGTLQQYKDPKRTRQNFDE